MTLNQLQAPNPHPSAVNQCIYEVGLQAVQAVTSKQRRKASGKRIMANRNKYGKSSPLEESLSERSKVRFQQQANFGKPWRRTLRFSEDGRVERLDILV